jgi:hypothetical protein
MTGVACDESVNEWRKTHGSLEHYPGRIELLMFTAEDGHQKLCGMQRIERPERGKPYLSKLEIEPMGPMSTGRFQNLLSPPAVHH